MNFALRALRTFAALCIAVVVFAGCSGGAEPASERADRATVAAEPTPIPAPDGVDSAGNPLTLEVVDGGPATGLVVTNHLGFAVYGLTGETTDALVCVDECLQVWIPVAPRIGTTASVLEPTLYGTFARPDGISQVTYNDIPLYTWARDEAVGITGGAGVAGTWFALTEEGGFVVTPA